MSKGCGVSPGAGWVSFDERCYALLRQIPEGRVSSYKEIAHALGTRAYRAVGNAMNRNPYDTHSYPCHRVVKSDGTIGGYAHGSDAKIARLEAEGITLDGGRLVDFEVIVMRAGEFDLSDLG
jgi:methylated-DNA-[protein]-cysteine S-methyltransferase